MRAERFGLSRTIAGPLGAGVLVACAGVALAVLVARFWLGLSGEHLKHLARFILISGGVSLLVMLATAWLLLHEMLGRLAFKLGVVCVIGPLVAAINTYYTANNMLIKQDDLGLLILLLIFSGGVGVTCALVLARTLTARIARLAHTAQQLGGGSMVAGAPGGIDEVDELGRVLNQLAARLQESDARRREMEEARRLLLAAVSHDLRTPLTSLRAVVESLEDGVVQDPRTATRYLASARQQIRYLETLIDDLFELARLDAGALELHPASMGAGMLVEEAVESVRARADEAGIRLHVHVAADLPAVTVDGQHVARVLLNLLSNALRYTPKDGEIEVRAERVEAAVQIRVRDSGVGIGAEDLPHVFERFYRGEKSRSRQHGGAGLGLAIAEGLVRAHGGRIWAESSPGSGATIGFTLPVTDASPHS